MQKQNINHSNNPLDVISRIAMRSYRHNLQRLTPLHRLHKTPKIIVRVRLSPAHKFHQYLRDKKLITNIITVIKIQCKDNKQIRQPRDYESLEK